MFDVVLAERTARDWHDDLVRLVGVFRVGKPCCLDVLGREALRLELRLGSRLHLVVDRADGTNVHVPGIHRPRREVGVSDICGEHTERAQPAGDGWADGLADSEFLRDLCSVRAAGSTADNNGIAARVDPAHDRNRAHRTDHLGVDDSVDRRCRFDRAHVEAVADGCQRMFGCRAVERHSSTEKILGIDIAEDQVCVGDGRYRAAVAITRGPRRGAGALRSYTQQATRIDPRHAPAARPDRMDVDSGHAERKARDLHIRTHRNLAARNHGHLEARTAHLDQHLISLAVAVTDEYTRRRAGRGPRADREHRPLLYLGHACRSAGDLHDQEVLLIAIVTKELGDLGQIVFDRRADVGAQHRGAGPRVFPDPGQDVGAQCRIGVWHFLGEDRPDTPFVRGIDHRPHQTHGDRVDAFLFEVGERALHAVFFERFLDFAGIEHAFGYAQAQMSRD